MPPVANIARPPASSTSARRLAVLIGAYALLQAAASYLTNEFVLTDELLGTEWSASYDSVRIADMLDQRKKWTLLGYSIIPGVLLVKISYTSLCLSTGCALADWTFRFRDIFRVSTHAEAVFAGALVMHLGWSLFGKEFTSVADYVSFYPFSALQFVRLDASEMWMAYPLKTANVFEVAYVGALGWGLTNVLRKAPRRVFALVVLSYGIGLMLLVASVTFLSLYVL